MSTYTYYLEVEEFGPFYAEIEITYDAWPGEKMVRYYPNGDGYPGSGPGCEITDAHVTHLEDSKHVYVRDLVDRKSLGGWLKDLDRLALEHVLKNEDEIVDILLKATSNYYYYDIDYDYDYDYDRDWS